MKSRRFRPAGIDALEDRLAMTAFAVPFTLITPPAAQVNPRNLVIAGRTEAQINSAITASFNRFTASFNKALAAYNVAATMNSVDPTTTSNRLQARVGNALARLNADLLATSRRLPFGRVNLDPVLVNRVTGTAGITDTTTGVFTPSLQAQLQSSLAANSATSARTAINATQALVRADVNNYVNLGVTNGYFRLGRGATTVAVAE